MNKTAQIINSTVALVMLACLTSNAMAGHSITQAKVNQITPGVTTESANGAVKRYIGYGHYVNGETRRYIERSHYSAQTGKNIQVGHL
jgi:hypothetical protein